MSLSTHQNPVNRAVAQGAPKGTHQRPEATDENLTKKDTAEVRFQRASATSPKANQYFFMLPIGSLFDKHSVASARVTAFWKIFGSSATANASL